MAPRNRRRSHPIYLYAALALALIFAAYSTYNAPRLSSEVGGTPSFRLSPLARVEADHNNVVFLTKAAGEAPLEASEAPPLETEHDSSFPKTVSAESETWAWGTSPALPLGLDRVGSSRLRRLMINHTLSRLRLCGAKLDLREPLLTQLIRRAFPEIRSKTIPHTHGELLVVAEFCATAAAAASRRHPGAKKGLKGRTRVLRLIARYKGEPESLAFHGATLSQLRKVDSLILAQYAQLVTLSALGRFLVWVGRPMPTSGLGFAEPMAIKTSVVDVVVPLLGTTHEILWSADLSALEEAALRMSRLLAPFEHALLAFDGAGEALALDVERALPLLSDGQYGERVFKRSSNELARLMNTTALSLRRLSFIHLCHAVESQTLLLLELRSALDTYRKHKCPPASEAQVAIATQMTKGSDGSAALSIALRKLHADEVLAQTTLMVSAAKGSKSRGFTALPLAELHSLLDASAHYLGRAEQWIEWGGAWNDGDGAAVAMLSEDGSPPSGCNPHALPMFGAIRKAFINQFRTPFMLWSEFSQHELMACSARELLVGVEEMFVTQIQFIATVVTLHEELGFKELGGFRSVTLAPKEQLGPRALLDAALLLIGQDSNTNQRLLPSGASLGDVFRELTACVVRRFLAECAVAAGGEDMSAAVWRATARELAALRVEEISTRAAKHEAMGELFALEGVPLPRWWSAMPPAQPSYEATALLPTPCRFDTNRAAGKKSATEALLPIRALTALYACGVFKRYVVKMALRRQREARTHIAAVYRAAAKLSAATLRSRIQLEVSAATALEPGRADRLGLLHLTALVTTLE